MGYNGDPTLNDPLYKTLTGSEFIALCVTAIGFDRVDELLAASPSVNLLLTKAEKVDRRYGNTEAAITRLMALSTNPLTQDEINSIDTAWRAK